MGKLAAFGLMIAVGLPSLAQADTLLMANGDRYSGKVSEQGDKLEIVLEYGGSLSLPRSAVKQWQREPHPKQSPSAMVASTVVVAPALTEAANSPAVSSWQLEGHGDVDMRLKRNDKQTDNLYLKGGMELANPSWRYSLDGEYTYETSDDVTKTHKYKLEPSVDYFFHRQAFWRSTISYNYDLLSPIYLQLDYLTGPGYRFWNDDKKKQRLELIALGGVSALSWNDEAPALVLLYGQHSADYPVARLQWDYRQPLFSSQLELYSEGTYQKYLHQASPYVYINQSIDGGIGLRYHLTAHLRLGIAQELEWDDAWLRFDSFKYPLNEKEWRQKISLGAQF